MDYCKLALNVIETEAQAVLDLGRRLDETFSKACKLLLDCKARIVVTGIGKSGHIANKIASTFSSTGTPAFFMHPAEASHGDFGMITKDDCVLAISNSGYTNELLIFIPLLKKLGVPLISMCGRKNSPLAKAASVNLDLSIKEEACPFNLAPTTSTTVSLVMGDALAITLLQARGFKIEDYAFSHPGGMLGKRLLLQVDDIWHSKEELPIVNQNTKISEALIEVNDKKLGMTTVVDDTGNLVGVYTDGDIRRTLTQNYDITNTLIKDVMTKNSKTITPGILAKEALDIMKKYSITSLVVLENSKPCAIIHMHDLLSAGVT